MPKLNNREDIVVNAVDGIRTHKPGAVELSSGVKLRVKKVPALVFPEVVKQFKRPEPPLVFNEDLGRKEVNLDDPTYKEAWNEWQTNLSMAIADTMIVVGTEIDFIPKGFSKPEDDEWTYAMTAIGIDLGVNPKKRYLLWVKYVACPADDDITKIMEAVGSLSGVSEADVDEAIDQFRNRS